MQTGISTNSQAVIRSIDTMLRKSTSVLETKIIVLEKRLDELKQQIILLQEDS